jgi:ketosteroid isomerase-like protein
MPRSMSRSSMTGITLLIPGAPPVHGVAAYRDALTPMFQGASYRAALTPPNKLEVAGPWAFAQYEGQVTPLPTGGGDSSTARNRYLDILRRQPTGTWRVYINSWQNDAPPTR